MPKFEAKKFKSCAGDEGDCISGELHVDGVHAASVNYDGRGGPYRWYWHDKVSQKTFEEFVASRPEVPFGGGMEGTFKPDNDWVFMELCGRIKMRKQCKTKTLFRLKHDDPDVYCILNVAFTPLIAGHLRSRHGDNLAEIINETLAADRCLNVNKGETNERPYC